MPKLVPEMGAIDVKRLRHPGAGRNVTFAVGGVPGLLLQITPSGARSWILRTTIGARRRDIGLGGYPAVGLAEARQLAREARAKVRMGIDPIEERKAVRAALAAAQGRLTFSDALDGYCSAKLAELATDRDRVRWRSMLERYAVPVIGNRLVADLTVQDMLQVLEPLWAEKTETARKLRSRLEAVLVWATVAGHRKGDNPARWKGNLDTLLPAPSRIAKRANRPAVALDDAQAWFAALRKCGGTGAQAVAFLALCASRSDEVREMTWGEIDFTAKVWTIPAERMKMKREHRVPLSEPALAILKAAPRMAGSPYVFTAPRGGIVSDATLSKVMRDMQKRAERAARKAGQDVDKAGWRDPRSGRPAVPHGLRSTFRDWVADKTEYPGDLGEIALSHKAGSDVERAYRRGDQLEKRRAMMGAWAAFLGAV